jgi:hypothetical protein
VGAVREHEGPTVARIPAERLSDEVRSSETPSAETTLRIQRAAGNRAVQRWLASHSLQRKEVADASQVSGATDWTTSDRTGNTQRWQAACFANLNAVDASEYRRIVERRDFYKWFYDYTVARGYTTRWPLAAWVVANGAHQIADMDETHSFANETIGLASPELQGYMREGNQVIFENVLPKLKRLIDGGPITGRAALQWDMQTLAEEQALVQPMYSRMSATAFSELNYIARQTRFAGWGAWWTNEAHVNPETNVAGGNVPGFNQSNLRSISDRWRYGMGLGNLFTPGGTGFNPATDTMPSVSADYISGAEFARLDWRPTLHFVDAWLGPNRISRGPVANLVAALGRLSTREKAEMMADSSPDGWAYSTQLAKWADVGVSESVVRGALPSDPGSAAAVSTFVARFNAAAARMRAQYPTPVLIPIGP